MSQQNENSNQKQPEAMDKVMEGLAKVMEEHNKAEYEIFKYSTKLLAPVYEKRREYTRKVPSFWPTVFDSSDLISQWVTFEDSELLEYLIDLYVSRDSDNPKNFTLTFEFAPNEYLESLVLTKKFTYIEPSTEKSEDNEDAEEEEGKYVSEPVPIKWKKHKNLTRPGPTTTDTSFFNFFNYVGSGSGDYKPGETVALVLAEDIYPHALKFFSSAGVDIEDEYDIEDDDSDSENDKNDTEEESEGEAPHKKKVKV